VVTCLHQHDYPITPMLETVYLYCLQRQPKALCLKPYTFNDDHKSPTGYVNSSVEKLSWTITDPKDLELFHLKHTVCHLNILGILAVESRRIARAASPLVKPENHPGPQCVMNCWYISEPRPSTCKINCNGNCNVKRSTKFYIGLVIVLSGQLTLRTLAWSLALDY